MKNLEKTVQPRYTSDELKAIDLIVKKEKKQGKVFKSEKQFSSFIKKLTK